ncbi:sugar phosphate isomerase/epimerase family protein [Paenibacillus sinopodophylli]|uniref:sugar phosphate isomerase/epimerase family protein n=1 Tax=Paenibacillus sinopodophylli TaxID=1837342 RepID=UPI00110D0A8D|nr:sugar phosphate isomerase/epimerase family protein [Paenibacillus sinopodophylli]
MKYAFNTASAPQLNLTELLAVARKYGYGGLEIRSGAGHSHGIEVTVSGEMRAAFKHEAAESGIVLTALGISSRFTTAVDAEQQIAAAAEAITLASDVGIPFVRLFCGRIVEEDSREVAMSRVVTALDRLAPLAEVGGVVLLLETHDDWSAPQTLAELLRRTAQSNLGVLWDVLHTQHEGGASPAEVVQLIGPWIKHVHVHDGVAGSKRENGHPHYRAIGSGDIVHAEVIHSLQGIGFAGYLSGEWFQWEPYDIHLPRELDALKQAERLAKEWGENAI